MRVIGDGQGSDEEQLGQMEVTVHMKYSLYVSRDVVIITCKILP